MLILSILFVIETFCLLINLKICTDVEIEVEFDLPKFQLTMELETGLRLRRKMRFLEDSDLEYKNELIVLTFSHLRRTGIEQFDLVSLNLVNKDLSESDDGSEIKAVFTGYVKIIAEEAPSESDKNDWILNSFNDVSNKEFFISDLDSAGHDTLTRIDDVTASLVVGNGEGNIDDDAETVELVATNSGFMTGMIVGIFLLTSAFSFAYHRSRRGRDKLRSKRSSKGYQLSDYYNDNDAHDEDANPNYSTWSHSPTKTLGYIAARSSREEINECLAKITSSHWNKKKTSMSKLAAGATQEEFVEHGMDIDVYGNSQSKKKKKKKASPVAKKGAELDTDLDPIVEVNSSVADSVSNQTDDKAVKSDLKVPKLLPSLSASSCPSDDGKIPYSPISAPALMAMTPDTQLEDIMTPFDDDLGVKAMSGYNRSNLSSSVGSPVRKLSFAPDSEQLSEQSSDSGLQGLLDCDRVVLSEEEALQAKLIAFIDDDIDNSCVSEDDSEEPYDEMIRQTLGSDYENKENIPPREEASDEFESTILVLSSKVEGSAEK